jgi:hypothetical protein
MNDTPKVTIHSGTAIHSDTARAEHDTARGDTAPKDRALPPGTVIDAKGRKIVCKLLSPLEQYRLSKIMGEAGESAWTRQIASNAATVQSINGVQEAFINNDSDIEAMIESLGDEGFEAVNEALKELLDAKPKKPNKGAAKN